MKMETSSTPLRYAFLTFRPHAGNPTALTDFLTIFLTRLANVTYYAHSLEDVGQPSQHFHCICSGNFKDGSKITQWLMTKAMKQFKDTLKGTQTIWEHALDIKLLPHTDEDMLTVLGYVLKSELKEDKNTQKIKGFTNEQCLQAVKIYFTSAKHKSKGTALKNDWVLLTKKNAHSIIDNFCHKNNMTLRDPDLEYKMYEAGYSFCDLTTKAQLQIHYEMLAREKKVNEIEREIIYSHIQNKSQDGKIDPHDPHPCDHKLIHEKHEDEMRSMMERYEKTLLDIYNGAPITKYVYPHVAKGDKYHPGGRDATIIPERYIEH
jgi:hypothetical protein